MISVYSVYFHPLNVSFLVSALFSVRLCEDEPIRKPIPVQDQTVKDEKGRYKRFHGAFTGGFSAGYFNSVGSKEGQTNTLRKAVTHRSCFLTELYITLSLTSNRMDAVDVCVIAEPEGGEAQCQTGGLHG